MTENSTIEATVKSLFSGIEFPAQPSGLYDPLRYMIEIGGKRIRPSLCLTVYSLFKDSFDETILEPAAALEVFHTFTLIHDDIMDNSVMRRGKPTVWTKWNEDTAILSGDVMCIDSYARLSKAPSAVLPEVLDLFSKTAAQVCEGQQLDMDFEEKEQVSMDEYMQMIGLKTAVLIAASAKMGAIIGGADAQVCSRIYEYGYNLGLAFQVADDYLDTYGDPKVFGKPIGGDIINNKKSWTLTRAFETGEKRRELKKALEMPTKTLHGRNLKIEAVRSIYDELGIGEDAKAEIIHLNARALRAVEGLEGFEVLQDFATKLVGRAK